MLESVAWFSHQRLFEPSRVRKDYAPANLALIRRIALTLLRQEKTCRLGIKSKCRRAGGVTPI